MGKVVGLIGSASGKIGNVVYAVSHGSQIARVYQPVVSNPKTGLQTMQRAKGNLAGRISGYTPKSAIFGMGNNGRSRRGAFLSNILKMATVTSDNGVFTAKIPQEAVKFSKGSVPLSVSYYTASTSQNAIIVNLRGMIGVDNYDAYQSRIVVMVYDFKSNDLVDVVTRIATKPEANEAAATTISLATTGDYIADIYIVPMSTSDGTAISISSDIAGLDDTQIAAALSVNSNAVVFNYGNSLFVQRVTFNAVP